MRARALLAFVTLTLAACGGGGSGGSDETGPAPVLYDFSAFDQAVQEFVDERAEVAGAGAILVHREDGVVFKKSYGAFDDSRIYLLASSSKMIAAGILMRLAEDGLLDLDQPIASLVDWASDHPEITTAQLLSNSSGLLGLNPSFAPYICQYLPTGTIQECARTILTTPDDDDGVIPPDTEFRYGGAQWQVAGAVAEVVSGKSWSQLLEEIYLEPCDLRTLGFNNHFVQFLGAGGTPFSYPLGFDGDPSRLAPTDNPNMEGGAYSDIEDYGRLLLMHLRGGTCGERRVHSEAAIRRLHEDRIAAYGGVTPNVFEGYGLGWWIDRDNPALRVDPGAYGAFPWVDEERGYAGFLVIEATTILGSELWARSVGAANDAIEAAHASDVVLATR